MWKKRVVRGLAVVLALGILAAAALGVRWLVYESREAAWREAFRVWLASVEAKGHPTTLSALNATLEEVSAEANGAQFIERIAAIYDDVFRRDENGDNPLGNIMWGDEPDADEAEAAKTLLVREAARIEEMWRLIDQACERRVLQAPDGPELYAPDPFHAGLDRAPQLLWLRAWAHPDTQVEQAAKALTLTERTVHLGGWRYYRAVELADEGVQMLRLAIERGDEPRQADLEALRAQLGRTVETVLDGLRKVPAYNRVFWSHHADPDEEKWFRRGDYEYMGWDGPPRLFGAYLAAFAESERIERQLQTEDGVRAAAARYEERSKIPAWNAQVPGVFYRARETLEVLTKLRLADLALGLAQRRGADGVLGLDDEELRAYLEGGGPRDAFTGLAFHGRVTEDLVFVGVPWRNVDFPARPVFTRSPRRMPSWKREPDAYWIEDSLRDDGWIFAVKRRRP